MTDATDTLPNDLHILKVLATAQRIEIEHLKRVIAKLQRLHFGRRSEQLESMIDHLPLYRQCEIYAREGVHLERSTLADWVGESSKLLQTLVNALELHVMSAEKIHADDTPIGVLSPGNGKTKTARLWTYVRDDRPAADTTPPAVWFAYSPDRKGERPRTHLKRFSGILQADAYAGFAQLYATVTIQEAAC